MGIDPFRNRNNYSDLNIDTINVITDILLLLRKSNLSINLIIID